MAKHNRPNGWLSMVICNLVRYWVVKLGCGYGWLNVVMGGLVWLCVDRCG